MVCSVGSVRMAVMARLLASGSFSRAVTEKAGRQKLVAQYIQKELLEADEANLLDEADMHVFGFNPLTDPLHLLCCNSCKKPVQASQFLVHTELCRSLGSAEELLTELDSGKGNRKPPRKERKKLVTAGNHMTSVGAHDRFAIVDASETAVSSSQLDNHVGIMPSCSEKAKETAGEISGSPGDMIPLTKRPKLVASDAVQPSDDICTVEGVSNIISCPDTTYVPVPLATKSYYSQRNNRLQRSITHMYHQASRMESQGNPITWEASPSRIISDDQLNNQLDKKCVSSSAGRQTADKISRESSQGILVKEEWQPSDDSLNEDPLTNAYTSQEAAFGELPTRYHLMLYSLSGKSGTPLPTI